MLFPIKCFTCGKVIASKYEYYKAQVAMKKRQQNIPVDEEQYLTSEFHEKSANGEVLDDMGINKMCCRRHFLTHTNVNP